MSRDLSQLTKLDKETVAEFAAHQMLRTKFQFNDAKRFLDDLYRPIESIINERIHRDERDFWLENLSSAEEYKIHLLNKVWVLAESSKKFYISDNPVVLQNSTNNGTHRGNLGLDSLGIEIYLPLSGSLVLCMFCNKTVLGCFF
jgi:hypothetical protein